MIIKIIKIIKLYSFFYSLQLCISVQIPEFLGGVFSSAVYIETNLNFTLKRIKGLTTNIYFKCSIPFHA